MPDLIRLVSFVLALYHRCCLLLALLKSRIFGLSVSIIIIMKNVCPQAEGGPTHKNRGVSVVTQIVTALLVKMLNY